MFGGQAVAEFFSDEKNIEDSIGDCYASHIKNLREGGKSSQWTKDEKFGSSIDTVLKDMINDCFNLSGIFKDANKGKDEDANKGYKLIDFEDTCEPTKFTGANWNFILMANLLKFSVWGNCRKKQQNNNFKQMLIDELGGNDEVIEFLKNGSSLDELCLRYICLSEVLWPSEKMDKEDWQKAELKKFMADNHRLVWIEMDNEGIDLMGKLLKKHYEKRNVENLEEKINTAVSDCKEYLRGLNIQDIINEFKVHESVKNLKQLAKSSDGATSQRTQYRVGHIMRDPGVLQYFISKSADRNERYPTFVEVGTESEPEDFVIVGDLHGNALALSAVLQKYLPQIVAGTRSLVLTGDYVDRGPHSLEIIIMLSLLKQIYPDRIFMLKGNHETTDYYSSKGFGAGLYNYGSNNHTSSITTSLKRAGMIQRNSSDQSKAIDEKIRKTVYTLFDNLPLVAKLNGTTICVHGCLPIEPDKDRKGAIKCVAGENFMKMDYANERSLEKGETVERLMTWNDINFNEKPQPLVLASDRGKEDVYKLSRAAVSEFMGMNKNPGTGYKAKYLIRGHQHELGYDALKDIGIYTTIAAFDKFLKGNGMIMELNGAKEPEGVNLEQYYADNKDDVDKMMTETLGQDALDEGKVYNDKGIAEWKKYALNAE